MNDLELCKKFAELEGVELVESFGKLHDASKLGKYGSEYNPITDLALNCAARDKYKVEIDYSLGNVAIYFPITFDEVNFENNKDIPRAVLECILKSRANHE